LAACDFERSGLTVEGVAFGIREVDLNAFSTFHGRV
jgi:hypothetical protein